MWETWRMSESSYKVRLSAKYKQAIEEPTKAKRAKELIGFLNLLVEEARRIKKDKDVSQQD